MSTEYEKAKGEHLKGAPYKTAYEAIKSPTFSKMHNARKKDTAKNRALLKMKK